MPSGASSGKIGKVIRYGQTITFMVITFRLKSFEFEDAQDPGFVLGMPLVLSNP
jgi:hypothetical protein